MVEEIFMNSYFFNISLYSHGICKLLQTKIDIGEGKKCLSPLGSKILTPIDAMHFEDQGTHNHPNAGSENNATVEQIVIEVVLYQANIQGRKYRVINSVVSMRIWKQRHRRTNYLGSFT